MQYILCVVYLIFSLSGMTFMKLGSMAENMRAILVPVVNLRITPLSLVGYLCYGISFLMYTVIITKFDLGYISPILSGISNIGILLIAFFVFKEHFTMSSAIGAVLIIAGVMIMNFK
ncbi:MAG: hypothetical protein UHU19_19300 [Lachnospiraceae bacterium]|nr:hypothetical protein [Lachnospiraceae bacterium]